MQMLISCDLAFCNGILWTYMIFLSWSQYCICRIHCSLNFKFKLKTLIKIFASLTLKQYLIIIFIIQIGNHKDAFVNIEYGIHFFSSFLVLFNVSRDQKYFSFKSRKKIKWKIKRRSPKLNPIRQIKVPNISHHFSMSAFYINGKTSLFIPFTTLTSEKNNTGFGK